MNRAVAIDVDLPGLFGAMLARDLDAVPADAAARRSPLLTRWDAGRQCAAARVAALRESGWHGPLMLLAGRGAPLAEALDAGVEDAATTDMAAGEIAARLARIVRRTPVAALRIGDVMIDPQRRDAFRGGNPLGLLPREFLLLSYLAERRDRAVSRAELLRAVWKLDFDPGTNVVQVHVSRLRARLRRSSAPLMLHTEYRKGYRLTAPRPA